MKGKQRLYIAYGSNLNLEQMAFRCPTAKKGACDGSLLLGRVVPPKLSHSVPLIVAISRDRMAFYFYEIKNNNAHSAQGNMAAMAAAPRRQNPASRISIKCF